MTAQRCGSHDFDFEFGGWRVSHRRLVERLAGCDSWQTFGGTAAVRPVLGGMGKIEDNVQDFPGGSIRAVALRSYDPASRTWAIWWLASGTPHRIDLPVIGRFDQGLGAVYADDMRRRAAIRVRFLWLRTATAQPRWEQAMSADGGQSWETNWTMEFDRR